MSDYHQKYKKYKYKYQLLKDSLIGGDIIHTDINNKIIFQDYLTENSYIINNFSDYFKKN